MEIRVFQPLWLEYGNEKASQLGKLRGLKSGYRSVGLWGGTAAEKNQLYWWGVSLPYFLNIHWFSCRVELNFYSDRPAEIPSRECYHAPRELAVS